MLALRSTDLISTRTRPWIRSIDTTFAAATDASDVIEFVRRSADGIGRSSSGSGSGSGSAAGVGADGAGGAGSTALAGVGAGAGSGTSGELVTAGSGSGAAGAAGAAGCWRLATTGDCFPTRDAKRSANASSDLGASGSAVGAALAGRELEVDDDEEVGLPIGVLGRLLPPPGSGSFFAFFLLTVEPARESLGEAVLTVGSGISSGSSSAALPGHAKIGHIRTLTSDCKRQSSIGTRHPVLERK